ncbi:hypothetical protein ACWEV4_10790 [Streptomyces sp. NPDC003860]
MAGEISAASGRPVRYVPLAPVDFVAEMTAQGWSREDAEGYVEILSPVRRGLDAHLSTGVQEALGVLPRDFAELAADAVGGGAWG